MVIGVAVTITSFTRRRLCNQMDWTIEGRQEGMTDGVLHSPLVLAFRDDSRGMHLGQHECHPKCRLNVAATMDTKKLGDRPPGFPPSGTKACFFL